MKGGVMLAENHKSALEALFLANVECLGKAAMIDKRAAALHEAGHAFVGQALGFTVCSASIQEDPELPETGFWVGEVGWSGVDLARLPPGIEVSAIEREEFRQRLLGLAGHVAEVMLDPIGPEVGMDVTGILASVEAEWPDLSESD